MRDRNCSNADRHLIRRHALLAEAVATILACVACGGATMAPSTAAPQAALAITLDKGAVAIQNVTTVSFDPGGSTGTDLRYLLEYGDGASDTIATAAIATSRPRFTHVYSTSGAMIPRLTVTDAQSRMSAATGSVTVKNLSGTWSTGARTLVLTQTAGQLSGTYTGPEGAGDASGSVSALRTVRLTTVGALSLTGTDLDGAGVSDDASALILFPSAGSAAGQRLTFSRQ